MEKDNEQSALKQDENASWYTEAFIGSSIENYLKANGYKIHKESLSNASDRNEKVITASKYFTKEIIGVKGLLTDHNRNALLKVADKNSWSQQAKNWFSETLFNSLVNFGKYYSDESAVVAMALPNVDRYKTIIEKVADYFTSNNLSFKLYLVDQNGEVEISNLNSKLPNE
jgi:hypothetical protein